MLRCIGQSKDNHGEITQCSNTSETPTNPKWPDVFLCRSCANALPNRNSRPQYQIELLDLDKPNDPLEETYEALNY